MNPKYQNFFNNLILLVEESFNTWYENEADHLDKKIFTIDKGIVNFKGWYENNRQGCKLFVKQKNMWMKCVMRAISELTQEVNSINHKCRPFDISQEKIERFRSKSLDE